MPDELTADQIHDRDRFYSEVQRLRRERAYRDARGVFLVEGLTTAAIVKQRLCGAARWQL